MTATSTSRSIPRPEHPEPQFYRENWLNLNGTWDFMFDFGASGMDRKFYEKAAYTHQICVPFCPESELSGIGYKDFIPCCWYHRGFHLTEEQCKGHVFLHFGAVDYEAHVFVNGKKAGVHKGGYVSFAMDITALVMAGENELTVCVYDDSRSNRQPRGKQSSLFYSHNCDYTRTTGIWQTVWLEFVPTSYIRSVRYFPNISEASLTIEAQVEGRGALSATAFFDGKECGSGSVMCENGTAFLKLKLTETHLWQVGQGNLYDLVLTFGEDAVKSYFGLREVRMDGYRFMLNGKSVFQRLILDQGFYPDGIYTAPDVQALARDIELSMAAGFNGARLHQKVFEPLFLYECDRRGYLVWGETGSWGLDIGDFSGYEAFEPEWLEILQRDFNHPAIIGWCPFNETWDYEGRRQADGVLRQIYRVTKLYDPTRPCIDTSGHFHVITDIYDLHDYEQDPEIFRSNYDAFGKGEGDFREIYPDRQRYIPGQPFFISEYGGIKWAPKRTEDAWGYGDAPKTETEYIERYRGLTKALLDNPRMMGFCYTQLTDVEQECNGIYYYDRTPKVDVKVFYEINTQKAAIED